MSSWGNSEIQKKTWFYYKGTTPEKVPFSPKGVFWVQQFRIQSSQNKIVIYFWFDKEKTRGCHLLTDDTFCFLKGYNYSFMKEPLSPEALFQFITSHIKMVILTFPFPKVGKDTNGATPSILFFRISLFLKVTQTRSGASAVVWRGGLK